MVSKHSGNKPVVVIIHGLHQRSWIMFWLSKQLAHAGFVTHCFDYASLTGSIEQHSQQLDNWLSQFHHPKVPVHLLGHSLGGLLIRHFVTHYPKWHIGNCVTLGTPHLGSVSADYVQRWLPFAVGRAYQGALDGSAPQLPDGICLGVIAGDKPYGLGQMFLSHHSRYQRCSAQDSAQDRQPASTHSGEQPCGGSFANNDFANNDCVQDSFRHDGTVYVAETRLPNAADHIILPVTHTGMLHDKTVARQTAYFLRHGCFQHGCS